MFKSYGLKHDFQVEYVLVEGFSHKGKKYRAVKTVPDFVFTIGEKIYIADTKFIITDMAALKFKMLRKKLMEDGVDFEIEFLKDKQEVRNYAKKMKSFMA